MPGLLLNENEAIKLSGMVVASRRVSLERIEVDLVYASANLLWAYDLLFCFLLIKLVTIRNFLI